VRTSSVYHMKAKRPQILPVDGILSGLCRVICIAGVLFQTNVFFQCVVHAQVPLPDRVVQFDAERTLSQDVTVSVDALNVISISGSVSVSIASATAGISPDPETDGSTTYNITVNGGIKKLTGTLDAAYSTGITLNLLLGSPSGGSAVERTLSTTTQDLVSGFGYVAETDLAITYTASATVLATPNGAGETRTVTITLTDN